MAPSLVLKPTQHHLRAMTADFDWCPAGRLSDDPEANAGGLLGRSVMKWGSDGELSSLDLQQILVRLSCVDEQAAALMHCPLDLP
jgi:hypothetical protein